MKKTILSLIVSVVTLSGVLKANAAEIKVKGFSLGMPAAEALNLLNNLFPNPQMLGDDGKEKKVYKIAKASDGYIIVWFDESKEPNLANPMASVFINMQSVYYPLIKTDENKKVDIIQISPSISDKLFNSSTLDGQEFVQKFMDAYNIPEFKPYTSGEESLWKYSSPEGTEIYIGTDKSIVIKKVPKSSFN